MTVNKGMTKGKMIEKVAASEQITKAAAERILDLIAKTIIADLVLDGVAHLPGLGRFRVGTRAAGTFRNPKTGVMVEKPAKKVVKFKPGVTMQARIADA
jgi:DNA-binding protein HU-beta